MRRFVFFIAAVALCFLAKLANVPCTFEYVCLVLGVAALVANVF